MLVKTLKPGETVGPMDVNPAGTYALVNIQRRDMTPGSNLGAYVDTGDVQVCSIAGAKGCTFVHIDNKALGVIQGRVTGGYHFIDGLVLFNASETTYTGHSQFTSSTGIVLHLNNLNESETIGAIYLDSAAVFTPQKDKLLFGVNERDNNSIAVYDMASGKIEYRALPNFGFGGIKAVSPNGKTAIVASNVNTVYIVPVRNPLPVQHVSIPLPSGQGPTAYSLKKAKFLSNTLVELTLENGKKYILDLTNNTLKKVTPPPPPKPAAPAPPPSPLDLLKNLQNELLGRLR